MMETVLDACFVGLFLAILLSLYRFARGPTLIDRILAFDMIAICTVGMVVLLSIRWDSELYLELVLLFSLLGFFGTVAFVYLYRMLEPRAAGAERQDRRRGRALGRGGRRR